MLSVVGGWRRGRGGGPCHPFRTLCSMAEVQEILAHLSATDGLMAGLGSING